MATIADYLTQLQVDKQTLVDNLNAKGVTATADETFTQLAPKVADIPSGSGSIVKSRPKVISFTESQDTVIDVSSIDFSNLTTPNYFQSMFSFCKKAKEIIFDKSVTINLTSTYQMFAQCSSLTTLDLSNFDTSNVTNMQSMFGNCSSLVTLDLSHFDTSNVTNMNSMFSSCSSLKNLKIRIMNCDCNLSWSPLSSESVAYILQNLGSGVSGKTLILGATNLAKATQEDLDSATAKGWTIK